MLDEFSPKRYIFSLAFIFVASAVALSLFLNKTNPESASIVTFLFFYLTLFLVCASGFALLGYILRAAISRNSPLAFFARVSLRQGVLLSFLTTTILFLQSLRSLTLLSVILLAVSLILLEVAFLTR